MVIGLVVAVFGLASALGGSVAPGVVVAPDAGVVLEVDPSSLAWRDGIRPGQVVVALAAADEAEGWAIATREGNSTLRSAAAPQSRLLQATQPVAALALVVAVIAVIRLPGGRRGAEAMASLAVVFASLPLAVEGQLGMSSVASALALVLPVAWIGRWVPLSWPARGGLLVVALVLVASWLALRILSHPTYVPLDQLRLAAVGAVTLGMLYAVGWRRLDLTMLTRPRLIDALSLAGLSVLAALLLLAKIPLLAVGLLVAFIAVVYPAFRRRMLRLLDRAFLAEQRERATIVSAEAERARLARELHDTPLQELAGVIKRLELVPGADQEEVALRDVAEQLRRLTSELHPPLLDDLGLVAAIEHLIDQARGAEPNVALTAAIQDRTGVARDERPPADVELSLYRIVQEALGNALRHAEAAAIRISGEVSATHARLQVEDDGAGFGRQAADKALRAGRLGLPSMRRRAEAIGADVEIDAQPGKGTRVAIEWEATA